MQLPREIFLITTSVFGGESSLTGLVFVWLNAIFPQTILSRKPYSLIVSPDIGHPYAPAGIQVFYLARCGWYSEGKSRVQEVEIFKCVNQRVSGQCSITESIPSYDNCFCLVKDKSF